MFYLIKKNKIMLHDLIPMVIMCAIVLGVYKIIELFVRRNERMAIIEKFSDLQSGPLQLPNISGSNTSWPLRVGLLLTGIGLGFLIGAIVDMATEHTRLSSSGVEVVYVSAASIFGGLGLVIAYLIERKQTR